MLEYIFGWLSSLITFVYKIPQIYKLYKDKNADGLSLLSLNIQGFGYILYSLHGYFNDDPPILWGMMPPFVQNCIIIGMVIYYNKYNSSRS